jgi:hypothetical protein
MGTPARKRLRRSVLVVAIVVGTVATSTAGYAAGIGLTSATLTTVRTCVLTASTTSPSTVADTYVSSGAATSNFGSATTMNVQSGRTDDRRVYVSFDLTACSPTIPVGATVAGAVLRTYVTALPSSCRTYDAYRVTSAWTESGITWNTQPTIGALSSSIDVGNSGQCANRNVAYVSGWDVSPDVQAFVSGGTTNRGWMIRDSVEGSNATRTGTFATEEAGTLVQAPQLIVVYPT